MLCKVTRPGSIPTKTTGIKKSAARWREAFLGLFILVCVPMLSSCFAGLQGAGLSPSLPKVETSQPAKYTKGAPAYAMRFHTMSSSVSGAGGGMSGAMNGAMSGGLGGAVSGAMGDVIGGLLSGSGDMRIASLRVISHPGPSGDSPKAYHMIPPAMNMGEYLPLLPPVKEAAPAYSGSESSKPERFVIKIYWGCGENVRQGQPRVIDSGKMTGRAGAVMAAFGGGHGASGRGWTDGLKPGWVEALWPNKDDSRQVPGSASLVGGHFLHGNFLPHMRFTMDARHDFMEKLSLKSEKDSLKEAIPITWKKVPTAIGYHLMAFAFSDSRKEMIIWTSSENPDINVAGEFLDTPTVKKYITSKVIMPADRDRCIIPRGIFDGMDVVMVTGTAWGDDYWASEPPRPANPPKSWKPAWVVKGQFLSTGGLMLGVSQGSDSGGSSGGSGLGDFLRGIFQ